MSSITDLLTGGQFANNPEFQYMGDFIQGTVTDNSNKEFSGMVKVEFTAWKSKNNIANWMPVLQNYAGKDYGNYIIPEIGDIVLVGFIGTDKKQPFVLGSLYPAQSEMKKQSFIDKNMNKAFLTKGKIAVNISDEKDKQSLSVATPKGLNMTLSDEKETITLSDKDGKNAINLDTKGGITEITADSKLTIKVGKCELTIDGKGGAVDIKCDKITIKANQQAAISGNQSVKVDGGMVSIQGKQTAELKGSTMTTISGGMVKIN